MAKTVLGVFDSIEQAERAADELQRRGFDRNEISIVAKESSARSDREGRGETTMMSDISGGVATGGAIGGVAGLLAGAGALAIPGLGPLVAAGPIAGALSGAVTGGIAGGLIDWGIPEESGRRYENRVKEGKIVAAVRTRDDKVEDAADILRRNGAYDVETH
ncbi:MAG TPA: hypothetical protein GX500_04290 [Firmicutes bacterium]|nr:hypothetical protein [Candidatus Fermentithermobacillaceae bacterium]